ncbi:MAG TPA: NAD(P)-binding domain-containing protein [Opitutaceae bacterium]|nr:NAD(P)-binding domain-containing protein [Opitutaceae bacterium]
MAPDVSPRIGFIGFGEVAAVLAEALAFKGVALHAFDVLLERPEGAATLRGRDRTARVRFAPLPEMIAAVDCVLSTVTTTVAVGAARQAAAHLRRGHTYVDLNATSPAIKQEVASLVTATGADFVEGAILGAIGVTGAKTKILLGGQRAEEVADRLTRVGLHTVFYSAEIGRASAFKLLRSVFSKGMEALLIETLVAGRRAGIQDDLWREMVDLFSANSFERVAANWIATHGTAHERRYHEVVQVTAELRALGVEPSMTTGTEELFARSTAMALKAKFAGRTPDADDVIAALARELPPKPTQ